MFTRNTINLGYERQFKSTWYRNFNVSFKFHLELFISETPEVHTDWVREKRRLKGSHKHASLNNRGLMSGGVLEKMETV